MFSGMAGSEMCLQQSIELLIASSALDFILYKRSEYLIYGEGLLGPLVCVSNFQTRS
jgi:hypothetical protein